MAIQAELRLGIRDFRANLDRATSEVRRSAGEMRRDSAGVGGALTAGFGGLRGVIPQIGAATVALGAMKIGVDGIRESMKRQQMEMALAAVSSDDLATQLERLKALAEAPGLGFDQVVMGSTRLQAVGFSAAEAEAALLQMGNALALVGGGKAEMDGVVTALVQIAAKGSVSAEEINQIAERMPQIRTLMKEAFGTADTEALQKMGISAQEFIGKVVEAAEDLPRAMDTATGALENLQDDWQSTLDAIGDMVEPSLGSTFGLVSAYLNALEADIRSLRGTLTDLAIGAVSEITGADAGTRAYLRGQAMGEIDAEGRRVGGEAPEIAEEDKTMQLEQARLAETAAKEQKEADEDREKKLREIARLKESIAKDELAMLPDDQQLAALEAKLRQLLQDTVGLFSLNFETSTAGLEKLARSRADDTALPLEGVNSAEEAYEWLAKARDLEKEIADIRADAAKKEADEARKRADELDAAREAAERGGFALLTPEQQAARLHQQLEASLGINVGSSADIDRGLASQRQAVADARTRGDAEAEKAALEDLQESQRLAKEFTDSAGALAPEAPDGGAGSLVGIVSEILGRDPQTQQVEELKTQTQLAREQRERLDKILDKMDDQPPPVLFGSF